MFNLLSNAIKFTNAGGEITVNMYDREEYIIISVKDTGIGIAEEDKDKIFGRFLQVEDMEHRNSEGSGLGLALVKSFVEMHGGKITLESTYGTGSNFIFKLPIMTVDEKEGKKEYINYNINSKVVGDYVYPSIIENLYKYQDVFISSNNELNKIINNENLSYNGTIIYKTGVNPISKSAELSYNINSSSDHIVANSMYNELNEQIATSSTFTNTDKLTILIAGIIILNISILNSIGASKRQGLIRLLGSSKKKTILIEILKRLICYLINLIMFLVR